MRIIKSILEFTFFCFLGLIIRPPFKILQAIYNHQEWINKKLSKDNLFKVED